MLISGAGNKRDFAARVIGGTPSMEDIVQKVAELEYLEEIQTYKLQRSSEYPEFGSQLDYIYHNGIDSWKTDIVDPVKAKYAKVEVDADELATRKATALAEYQLAEYSKAVDRLAKYQLSVGQEEIIEEVIVGTTAALNEEESHYLDEDGNIVMDNITETTIKKISIDAIPETVFGEPNPLITQDNAERAEAQLVIDSTPQAVIDVYNV
jgi:hypothetical protein